MISERRGGEREGKREEGEGGRKGEREEGRPRGKQLYLLSLPWTRDVKICFSTASVASHLSSRINVWKKQKQNA
jgi:hypothetical protein